MEEMTIEEALDKLKECLYYAKALELKYMTASVDALEVAGQALEKQIPKRVETGDRCPSCNRDVVGSGFYCWNCGQRLDWGE